MEFRFENKLTACDMWKLSMRRIYRSLMGASNILISLAAIVFTIRYWNPEEKLLMAVLIMFCVLFPVVQPAMIYLRAAKQVRALPENMVFEINNAGLFVITKEQKLHIPWKGIHGAIKEKGMLILAADSGRGYMLTDKMLGTQKEAFLKFLEDKLKRNK